MTNHNGLCSDTGAIPVDTYDDCVVAAKTLVHSLYPYMDVDDIKNQTEQSAPAGCYVFYLGLREKHYDTIYYNFVEGRGKRHDLARQICSNQG